MPTFEDGNGPIIKIAGLPKLFGGVYGPAARVSHHGGRRSPLRRCGVRRVRETGGWAAVIDSYPFWVDKPYCDGSVSDFEAPKGPSIGGLGAKPPAVGAW